MKIILTHEVEGLGSAGDVIEVKDGYGRNYLVPQGLAIRWTRGAQSQADAAGTEGAEPEAGSSSNDEDVVDAEIVDDEEPKK